MGHAGNPKTYDIWRLGAFLVNVATSIIKLTSAHAGESVGSILRATKILTLSFILHYASLLYNGLEFPRALRNRLQSNVTEMRLGQSSESMVF